MPEKRLTCPKCGGQFDYQFVWGASLTAVRLGPDRYMRCPLCQKWALFRLLGPGTEVPSVLPPSSVGPIFRSPEASVTAASTPSTAPLRGATFPQARRFSDVKITVIGGGVLGSIAVAIVILAYLLTPPEPRLAAVLGGLVVLVTVAVVFFFVFRIREKPRPSH